jgi:hypothetical protein
MGRTVMADGFDLDPAPEDLARRALQWFLRGGTWQGLAREAAWTAVQAAGANYATIEWLTPLVEERLADTVDGLEYAVDIASVRARGQYVRRRPDDLEGAETAAIRDGYDAAVQRLSAHYLDAVEWAADLIAERLDSATRRKRYSPFAVRRRRAPVDPESSRDVASELVRDRGPLGRRHGRAA